MSLMVQCDGCAATDRMEDAAYQQPVIMLNGYRVPLHLCPACQRLLRCNEPQTLALLARLLREALPPLIARLQVQTPVERRG